MEKSKKQKWIEKKKKKEEKEGGSISKKQKRKKKGKGTKENAVLMKMILSAKKKLWHDLYQQQ